MANRPIEAAPNASENGIWSWDASDGLVTGDRNLRPILGLGGKDTFTAEDCLQRIHEEDCVRVRGAIESAVAIGDSIDEECRLVPQGGDARWVPRRGTSRT